MKKSLFTVSLAAVLCLPSLATATLWHYDFNVGEDLTAFTVVNPTGSPSTSLTASPGDLRMHTPGTSGSGYGGYDLCTGVNMNAYRMYHAVDNAAFTLETKMSTTATTHTFISGLYLFSNDGNYANDWVFGANNNSLKIDKGSGTSTGPNTAPWTGIGAYADLYLQVLYNGSGGYTFNYKMNEPDSWSYYAGFSNSSMTHVGLITKTWRPPGGVSPVVDADFDYLYYNYTPDPDPIPEPATMLLFGTGLAGLVGSRLRRKKK